MVTRKKQTNQKQKTKPKTKKINKTTQQQKPTKKNEKTKKKRISILLTQQKQNKLKSNWLQDYKVYYREAKLAFFVTQSRLPVCDWHTKKKKEKKEKKIPHTNKQQQQQQQKNPIMFSWQLRPQLSHTTEFHKA